MFHLQLHIGTIDYETTFQTVFPFFLEKCKKHESSHFFFRFLKELDSAALPVMLGIIQQVSNDARDGLLCQCMKSYGPTLTSSLNRYLQTDSWGKNFTIGYINVVQRAGSLLVFAGNVQADYQTLLDSDRVKEKIGSAVGRFAGAGLLGKLAEKATQGALNAVKEMNPEDIEKGSAALLENRAVQNKLLRVVADALNSRGIAVTLNGIEIVTDTPAIAPDDGHFLTPELEAAVIHAICEYLKKSIPS